MEKKFVTAITCMDGRIQSLVNKFLQQKYGRLYIDTITAAGPVLILSERRKRRIIKDIQFRTNISINIHSSNAIAVVGHFDCAGVQMSNEKQIEHIRNSVKEVRRWYSDVEVIGLWVPNEFEIVEIEA